MNRNKDNIMEEEDLDSKFNVNNNDYKYVYKISIYCMIKDKVKIGRFIA